MGWENGFVGRFAQETGAWHSKSRALGSGRFPAAKSQVFGIPWAASACSPRLRCKSGLCYTADANSPFEAYIYVR
jgi:hypothetical protein